VFRCYFPTNRGCFCALCGVFRQSRSTVLRECHDGVVLCVATGLSLVALVLLIVANGMPNWSHGFVSIGHKGGFGVGTGVAKWSPWRLCFTQSANVQQCMTCTRPFFDSSGSLSVLPSCFQRDSKRLLLLP
jgi:hypothetical protein